MKYCVLIMDGAAGLPIPERGGKTSLELARTPNLDAMARTGMVGLAHTVPAGLEPDSAVACMSLFGYDPRQYYRGRAPIEAMSLDIPSRPGDVLFRCNLVTVQDGRMRSHSAGYISTEEARELFAALESETGSERVRIFPGVSYRGILRVSQSPETARAHCTPPHDIPGRLVSEYMPRGEGSQPLLDLMERSRDVLRDHPVNERRIARGDLPATQIWLFWGSGAIPPVPSFQDAYGQRAAVSSGVHLLKGLGKMAGMAVLETAGVTDGLDNDTAEQTRVALTTLKDYDIVIVHVEAPDEAGHSGSVKDKVEAIERIDAAAASQIRGWRGDLRVLVSADHPTPVTLRTHTPDPVPFLIWGTGVAPNGAARLTESDAKHTGLAVDPGFMIMRKLIGV